MSTSKSLFCSSVNRIAAFAACVGAVAALAVGTGHLAGHAAANASLVRADGPSVTVVVPPIIPLPPVLPGDGGVAGWTERQRAEREHQMAITDLTGDLDLAATLTQLAQQVSAAQTRVTTAATEPDRVAPRETVDDATTITGRDAVIETVRATLAAPHRDAVWIAPSEHVMPLSAISGEHLPLRVLVPGADLAESSCGLHMRAASMIPGREMLVVDSSTLLLPYRGDTGEASLIVARQPRTAMLLQAVFDSLWTGAVPTQRVGAVLHALDSSLRREIVRLLAGGATDETIARRLGISKRTCSRHVAHILACSGASSRFQAGIMLARSGLDLSA